jgi:hypothetical protein
VDKSFPDNDIDDDSTADHFYQHEIDDAEPMTGVFAGRRGAMWPVVVGTVLCLLSAVITWVIAGWLGMK